MQLPAADHPPLAPYPPVTEVARRGCDPSGWRGRPDRGLVVDGCSDRTGFLRTEAPYQPDNGWTSWLGFGWGVVEPVVYFAAV